MSPLEALARIVDAADRWKPAYDSQADPVLHDVWDVLLKHGLAHDVHLHARGRDLLDRARKAGVL